MVNQARDTETDSANSARPHGVRALVASAAVSSVGDGAFVAAAPLLAAFLTRDPLAVSVVSAASAAPWLLVGLWSGALVDRLPRRAVMLAADATRALGLGLLAILVLRDMANIPALASAAFLVTSGQCFFDAASQAIVPQLVGRSSASLAHTNGRLVAVDTAGRSLAGPSIGGLLFAAAPWAPFALDAASFAVSGAVLAGVPKRSAPSSEHQNLWLAVRQGFAYLLRDRPLVVLAAVLGLHNLAFNMAFGTFVLYAQDVLGMESAGFGLLLTAGSFGAIVMGWRAKSVVRKIGVRGSVVLAALIQAAGWASLAVSGSRVVAVAVLVFVGAASTLLTVVVVTARQQLVPDHLLGRVVSAFRVFGNGAAPLGAAIGGLLASAFGLQTPMWVAAVVALGALVVLQFDRRRPSTL